MSIPPYLRRKQAEPIGTAGRKSEKKLAGQLKGRVRRGSGNMEGAKGDIDLDAVLMEAKSTTSNSLGLKLDWLGKISREARSEAKMAALSVTFTTPDGLPRMDGQWVLVPLHHWNERLK